MRADIRRRLQRLETGNQDDARRYAIIERELAKRYEEWGIPEPTEADRAAFEKAYDASKPGNWSELSSMEQTDHFIQFALREAL